MASGEIVKTTPATTAPAHRRGEVLILQLNDHQLSVSGMKMIAAANGIDIIDLILLCSRWLEKRNTPVENTSQYCVV